MSKAEMIGLVKTFSAYNTYVEKNNEDPAIMLEKGIKEDQVTGVFDFFMIACSKWLLNIKKLREHAESTW